MIRWYCYLVLFFVCALLYAPGLCGPLIFDSLPALTGNPAIHVAPGSAFDWLAAAGSSSTGPLGRPLAIISFSLNLLVADGLSIPALKAVNIAIHLACGLVLMLLTRALVRTSLVPEHCSHTDRSLLVFVIVSLWLLHPLNVSTVLYTVQRMAQLSALFSLLALFFYCHYRLEALRASDGEGAKLLSRGIFLAVLCGIAATLAKENGLLVFWLLPVVELYCFSDRKVPVLNLLYRSLPWLVWLPLIYLLTVVLLPPDWLLGGYRSRGFSLEERVLTQARVLWLYLGWLAWPDLGQMGFHHDDVGLSRGFFAPVSTLFALFSWVAIGFAGWVSRTRIPVLSFALVWFLIAHAMESTVAPLELIYEHRNYFASIGVCVLIGGFLVGIRTRSRPVAMVATIGIVLIYSALLGVRVSYWSDELKLARHHLQHHPDSARTLYHYANTAYRLGSGEMGAELNQELLLESRAAYQLALEQEPGNMAAIAALVWLDSIYFEGANPDYWIQELDRAIENRHLTASDFNALTTIAACAGYAACAIDPDIHSTQIQNLRLRYPHSVDLAAREARFYREVMGQPDVAVDMTRTGLQTWPGSIELHRELIAALVAAGDSGAALEAMRGLAAYSDSIYRLQELRNMFAPKGNST